MYKLTNKYISDFLSSIIKSQPLQEQEAEFALSKLIVRNEEVSFDRATVQIQGRKCIVSVSIYAKYPGQVIVNVEEQLHIDMAEKIRVNFEALEYINIAIDAQLTDGRRLEVSQATSCNIYSKGGRVQFEYEQTIVFECTRWALTQPGQKAQFFVGKIVGAPHFHPGNLIIMTDCGYDSNCIYLKGSYDYYLLNIGGRHATYFIIDIGQRESIDRQLVYQDFLVLQFAFGANMSIDLFKTYSAQCEPIGLAQGDYGNSSAAAEENKGFTIPLYSESSVWVAEFFELTCKKYLENPQLKLFVPLESFLSSLSMSVDKGYLHLQVGLEAFAGKIMNIDKLSTTEPLLNKDEWKKWVKARRTEIVAFVIKDLQESYFQKIATAYKYFVKQVVPTVFKYYGLQLTEQMKRELDRRDYIVHQLTMVMDDEESQEVEFDEELSTAVVRTMLVALVAKVVGYWGPIFGWQTNTDGSYALVDEAWWPSRDESHLVESSGQYLAGLEAKQIDDKVMGFRQWEGVLGGCYISIDNALYMLRKTKDGSFREMTDVPDVHRIMIEKLLGRTLL